MLSQLIKALTSGVSGAQPVAGSYVGQFSRLGLDTGPVNKLLADYAWATSQQPMLQRRYSLASHQPPGSWSDGWTSEGAGPLLYGSTAAAKGAGTADAKQLQQYLDDHDWSGIQKELDNLTQNQGDADYMAAFFSQLGPTGLYALSGYAQGGAVSDSDAQEVQDVVGNSLATASYEMPLTMKFLQGIESSNEPPGETPQTLPGGWDSGALAPFLTEGEYSSQWLNVIAPAVLYQKDVEMGAPLPGGYDAIFQAMANNPGFAAQFYSQNAGQLNDYMTDPVLYNQLASGQSFGKFLEAATIAPPGATDTAPFTANATRFIRLFGDSGADTSTAVRQVMAALTVNYFSDLTGVVTSAAPGMTSPMGLSAQEWGQFVQDAMKDNTSAAYLLAFYANWSQNQPLDNVPKNGQGDTPQTPGGAGYWHDFSSGMLDYFFASNYQAAGSTAGDDGNAVLSLLKGAATAGAATLITSVVFGPEAGAFVITTDMLEDSGKDAFSSAVEGGLDDLTEKIGDGGDGPADALDSSLTDVQQRWADKVIQDYQQNGAKPGPGNQGTVSPVWYNGQQYTGDPLQYEQQYSPGSGKAGYFMDSGGNLLYNTPGEWAKHPQALAAYNAWLKDPAISNMTGTLFGSVTSGSVNSLYQQLMSNGQ
jgi:hypothetical protein